MKYVNGSSVIRATSLARSTCCHNNRRVVAANARHQPSQIALSAPDTSPLTHGIPGDGGGNNAGNMEFAGVPKKTCLCIGSDGREQADQRKI